MHAQIISFHKTKNYRETLRLAKKNICLKLDNYRNLYKESYTTKMCRLAAKI